MDAETLDGSPVSDGEEHAQFLRTLAMHDDGKAIVVNLEASLRLDFIDPDTCVRFLDNCVATRPYAISKHVLDAIKAFQSNAKSPDFQFLRAPPPDIQTRVALALRAALLYDESIGFLTDEGREELLTSGLHFDQLDQPAMQSELLRKLRTSQILKPDAALGSAGILVWATRADTAWDDLVRSCERTRCANRVRDRLGLPHPAGQVYFELRTSQHLSAYCAADQSRRVAAPTTFDAGFHRRFKQEPDAAASDHWNRAIDLDLAFVAQVAVADGAPELVINRLSFREITWERCLGVTDKDAPGTNDDARFIDRLANSRTAGRRAIDVMISAMIDRLKAGNARSAPE